MTTGARPLSDGMNGLEVVRVLEAAERSLRTGETVEIEHTKTDMGERNAS
jgi:hypothetical protein